MTREQIEREFRIEHNTIQDAGKFEQQPMYAPYFYELWLDGQAESIYETDELYFQIDNDDYHEFPELKQYEYIILDCNDNGFAYCKPYKQRAFYDYMWEVTGDEDYQPA